MTGFKKNVKSISFFKRILFGYLAILIVPACTGIITYYTSSRIITNEISVTNNAILDYGLQEMDMQFANGNEVINKILFSSELLNCISKEVSCEKFDGYSELQLNEYLNSFSEDYFADIMVYFHQSDRVVSSVLSSLDSYLYYSTYYKTEGNDYEDWLAVLRGNSGVKTIHMGEKEPTIAIVQKYPINQIGTSATIVIVLRRNLLYDFLKNLIGEEDKTFLIVNQEDQPLITVGEDVDYLSLKENLYEENVVEDANSGNRYVYQAVESTNSPIRYVCIVPFSTFWQKMESLRFVNMISYGIFIIVSAIAVVLLSRMAYRPFGSFITDLTKRTNIDYNRRENSEMDYLNQVFAITMKEKEQLRRKMDSEKILLIDDIMLKALQGMINIEDDIIETLKTYNISLSFSDFLIAVFKIDSWNSEKVTNISEESVQNMIRYQIEDRSGEVLGKENSYYVTRIERRKYVCIINTSRKEGFSDNTHVLEGIQKVRGLLEQSLGISFTIGISKNFNDRKSLHEGFLQASEAMEYRAAFGRGIVIHYQDIRKRKFAYASSNITAQKKIISYIKDKKQEIGALKLIEGLIQCSMDEETASLEVFKCFRLDMINIIANVMNEICSSLFISENAFVDKLMSCETFQDFKFHFVNILETLQSYEAEHSNENDLGKSVMSYITENYADSNLNINMLGEVFSLSPSYLSKIFKEQIGLSPHEFITKLRINKSKELIEDGNITIEGIAEAVGFLSSSVFIRTFKKIEGITPGSYKKVKKI